LLNNLLIFDGESPFGTNEFGQVNSVEAFRGLGCFEGIPGQWNAPRLLFNDLPSYGADISGYDELWFFAKADRQGGGTNFQVVGRSNEQGNVVNINDYFVEGQLDTEYKLVRIPMADLATDSFSVDSVSGINFGFAQQILAPQQADLQHLAVPHFSNAEKQDGYSFFIDEIWAVNLTAFDVDSAPLVGELPAMDFGDVPVGTSATLPIQIYNVGNGPLNVSVATFTGEDASSFSANWEPFVVPVGESSTQEVICTPQTSGDLDAILVVNHDPTGMGTTSQTALLGVGNSAELTISLSEIDFGRVPVNQSVSWELLISNVGVQTLNITDITLSSGILSVSTTTLTVAPGEVESLFISVSPDTIADLQAVATLHTSDPSNAQVPINIQVEGLPADSVAEIALLTEEITSSTMSLRWWQYADADSIQVYIAPEPSATTLGALPGETLVQTLSGTADTTTIERLAAATDVFVRIVVNGPAGILAEGKVHGHTPGGLGASLNTPLRQVHMAAPNILQIVIENAHVHSFIDANDWYDEGFDEVVGDTGSTWQAGPWTVSRADGTPIEVTDVYRSTMPVGQPYYDVGYAAPTNDNFVDLDHHIFLVLGENLGSPATIEVQGPSFDYDYMEGTIERVLPIVRSTRSAEMDFIWPFSDRYAQTPVIQVNQVGYSPQATERWAYVSGMLGDGGPLALDAFPGTAHVLEDHSDMMTVRTPLVADIPVTLRSAFDEDSGTAVNQIDLTGVAAQEGRVLRVSLPGVGVSWPTQVSETAVAKAFYVLSRGLYLNRWGRDLQPQWTDWSPRPPDHPTVFTCDCQNQRWVPADTPQTGVRPLVGGHHDAGDFDINKLHYIVGMLLMRSYEMSPDKFYDGQMTIPESGNGIPDILDEALWSLAAWEQLQEEDGLVWVGVESHRHPWGYYFADEEPLPYWTRGDNPAHNLRVAALFAQASRLVAPYDAEKASVLKERSIRAYENGRLNGAIEIGGPDFYANGELFRLTQESVYSDRFESYWHDRDQWGYGPDIYRRLPWASSYLADGQPTISDFVLGYLASEGHDASIKSTSITYLEGLADGLVEDMQDFHAHRNPRTAGGSPSWGVGSAVGRELLNLYASLQLDAVGAEKRQVYINAVSMSADFVLGCNPLGISWVSGLGSYYPTDVLHGDALAFRRAGLPALPGIPVYGPVENLDGQSYNQYTVRLMYPALETLPLMRRYADSHTLVMMNEFTVWETQVPQTQLFAILLAPGFEPPDSWLPGGTEHRSTIAPRASAMNAK
jgi:endoglucanase